MTSDRLRELATLTAERGCAVSFYLDLDPSDTPTAGDAASRVNSLLVEAEKWQDERRDELAHEQKQGLRSDLERIRAYVGGDFDRDGARGLAIFASGLDGIWSSLALLEPVPDRIEIGRGFYLAPLVPLLGRGRGAIVAVVGREQGLLYQLHAGRLQEVVDHTEHQPRRHDQGGRSQSRLQRHLDNRAWEHVRTVVDDLNRLARRLPDAGVVIVCAEELRGDLGELLGQEVQRALAGWTTAEAHASPAELLETVTPILEDWHAGREAATIERWREEAGRNGRATSGWAATLEAVSDARVELLLFQDGVDRQAWRCPQCGRASAGEGECPLDGASMEPYEGGIDLAIHHTLVNGGSLCAVRHHHDLEPVEGIGALLRY